jgi:predicted DNA-binding antitoxin AbrB/MazE fold protein
MYTIIEYAVDEKGVLAPLNDKELQKFNRLLLSLKPGNRVSMMCEVVKDDHSLVQLAKVHALIRELAHCTGNEFEDVKLEVKRKAGLTVKAKDSEGKSLEYVKSFADCSKEQLSMAIEACILIGEDVGCILY